MKKEKRKARKKNNFRDILIIALVLVLGFSLYQLYQRVEAYMQAEQELAQAEAEKLALEKEEQENQRLLIQSDSESLMEKLAREQLGMVKPGETVYRLSPKVGLVGEIGIFSTVWGGNDEFNVLAGPTTLLRVGLVM